jgi:hypothetical protein
MSSMAQPSPLRKSGPSSDVVSDNLHLTTPSEGGHGSSSTTTTRPDRVGNTSSIASPEIDSEKNKSRGTSIAEDEAGECGSTGRTEEERHRFTPDDNHQGSPSFLRSGQIGNQPISPSMSNAHPPPGPHRQTVPYPGQPTYSPHGGMTTHYPYPPHQSQPADPYRTASQETAVNSSMTLPSMRTIDPLQAQQPHHSMPMGNPMGAPLHQAPTPIYYSMQHHPYGLHHDPNALRYALPPNLADPRIALSGGRHKKVR